MSDASIHGPATDIVDAPSRPPPLPATAWSWIGIGVVAGVVFVVLMASDLLSDADKQGVSAIVTAAASAFATGATVRAARRSIGTWRRAWTFVALSTGLWLIGNVISVVFGAFSDDVVFPSPADIFWVPALPMAIAALVTIPGRLTWRGGSRIGIDGGLLAVVLLFTTWELLLADAFDDADLSGYAKALLLTYWVLDTLTFAMAVNVVLRSRRGLKGTVGLVCAGYIIYTLTDAAFLARSLDGSFHLGSPVDIGWIIAQVLIGGTALAVARRPGTMRPRPPQRASDRRVLAGSLLPLVGFLVVFVVYVASGELASGTARAIEIVFIIAVSVLFVVAQFTTLRENLRLASGLEATVAARTKQLSDAVALQDLTLRTVADGILGFYQGQIVLANDAACDMLHLAERDILGKIVPEVLTIGPGDHSRLVTIFQALSEKRLFSSDSETITRRDGTAFAAEVTVAPVLGEHATLASVAVFRDVTHRHEVDRMKDEFVSVVSHELRTPLTSIRGSLGLLAGGAVGELPEAGRRMVEIAVENTDRLIRLINDILDIERIESGAVVLHQTRCEVADLVAESLRTVVPVAKAAGVDIGLAKIEGVVWADSDRVVQTLTNLLSNAVKFSPNGGVVTLSASVSGEQVEFSVADEGRGIPADKLESIFGRFQQVDASDSRQKGGTGLGLAISRSIVEQHGGRIWAESHDGRGSTFRFTLPAVVDPNVAPLAPAGEGPLVLVCDDDPSLLEVARMLLSTHGYRALVAQTGEEAVRLAAAEQPAVIILDLYMPAMDGWQTVDALRADPATAQIPVLVLSVVDVDDGAGLGDLVQRWITKPVSNSDALLEAVAQLVDGDHRTPRVLVVEDDEDLARVLTTSLEQRGLRVLSAPTASAATRLSRTFLPDLIVLDIVLPDGDGFAVVEQLRQDGRLSTVPLVVYTAREVSESDRRRLTLGETEVLFKSTVTPEAFEERVLALLEGAVGPSTRRGEQGGTG